MDNIASSRAFGATSNNFLDSMADAVSSKNADLEEKLANTDTNDTSALIKLQSSLAQTNMQTTMLSSIVSARDNAKAECARNMK